MSSVTPGPPIAGEAFPPSARVRRQAEFQAIFSRGWRCPKDHLVVHLLANGRETSRLGLTISRKVGNAVARNRVRRRLRESFRRRLRASVPGPHVDLVLRVLPGAAGVTQAVLEREVAEAIETWERRGRPAGRPRRDPSHRKTPSTP